MPSRNLVLCQSRMEAGTGGHRGIPAVGVEAESFHREVVPASRAVESFDNEWFGAAIETGAASILPRRRLPRWMLTDQVSRETKNSDAGSSWRMKLWMRLNRMLVTHVFADSRWQLVACHVGLGQNHRVYPTRLAAPHPIRFGRAAEKPKKSAWGKIHRA